MKNNDDIEDTLIPIFALLYAVVLCEITWALVACWCHLTDGTKSFNHIKGYITLVLMYSGIVNGYQHQLLCDAHTVLEPHRGTAVFFSILLTIVLFHFFLGLFHCDSPFLGCLFSLCK